MKGGNRSQAVSQEVKLQVYPGGEGMTEGRDRGCLLNLAWATEQIVIPWVKQKMLEKRNLSTMGNHVPKALKVLGWPVVPLLGLSIGRDWVLDSSTLYLLRGARRTAERSPQPAFLLLPWTFFRHFHQSLAPPSCVLHTHNYKKPTPKAWWFRFIVQLVLYDAPNKLFPKIWCHLILTGIARVKC